LLTCWVFYYILKWWEEGIEATGKMVISYDNLISRLWLNGAIMPHAASKTATKASIDTLVDEKGLPPVPHGYWVGRLGFQYVLVATSSSEWMKY